MVTFFLILQFVLLLFMLFHDWIPLPPFNNIAALKTANTRFFLLMGSFVNGTLVLIPLTITFLYYNKENVSIYLTLLVVIFYLTLTIGTILSWWIPYIFGSSQGHKHRFSKFKNTHHFLPSRGNNVVPNTLHVILHLQVWLCLGISIYFLINKV